MQPYVLTPSAEDDIKDIARYTLKQWGKKQSLQYASLLNMFSGDCRQTSHSRFLLWTLSSNTGNPCEASLHLLHSCWRKSGLAYRSSAWTLDRVARLKKPLDDTTNDFIAFRRAFFSCIPQGERISPSRDNAEIAVYGNAGSGRNLLCDQGDFNNIWYPWNPLTMASTTSCRLAAFKFSSICGAGYLHG